HLAACIAARLAVDAHATTVEQLPHTRPGQFEPALQPLPQRLAGVPSGDHIVARPAQGFANSRGSMRSRNSTDVTVASMYFCPCCTMTTFMGRLTPCTSL